MSFRTCADGGEYFEGGLGVRPVVLSADHPSVDLHAHRFDHVMFFAEGEATVTANCPCGVVNVHDAKPGDSLLVPATWTHGVVAKSPRVKFWCVFAGFDANGQRQGDCTEEAH